MKKLKEIHAGHHGAEADRAASKLYDLIMELGSLARYIDADDDAARGQDAARQMEQAADACAEAWNHARAAVRALHANVNECPECESTNTDSTDPDHPINRAESHVDRICKDCDHEWITRR